MTDVAPDDPRNDDLAEFDLTEEQIDAMWEAGEPVEVTGPQRYYSVSAGPLTRSFSDWPYVQPVGRSQPLVGPATAASRTAVASGA